MTSSNNIAKKSSLLAGEWPTIVIISIIATFYCIWTWSPILAQLGGDNATYLLTAKLFSPYSESSYVSEYFTTNTPYPPLYPLLLALVGGGESILIAHLLTTFLLIAAILVMYKWAIVMRLGKVHALVLIIIFAMIPGTYMQALSILSENLYLLLSLSALCVISLKENIGKWLWVAVFLIVCSSLTRSAGLPLVLSFVIYLFIKKNSNKYLLSLSAILPMFIWGLLNTQGDTSYVAIFSENYSTSFVSTISKQILDQSIYMLSIWHRTFTNGSSGYLLLSVFAILCVFGMIYSLYLKRIDGIYVLLYLLMILIWPYPAESMRLLYPVIPVLLVQTSIFIKNLTPGLNSTYGFHIGNIVLEGILLIILVPNLILTISRFNVPVDEYLIPYKRTYDWHDPNLRQAINKIAFNHGIISGLEDAKNHVPIDECVYSIKPSLVGLYMKRISKGPPDSDIDDNEYFKITEQENCHYYYLVNGTSPSYSQYFYPYGRIKNNIDIMKAYYSDEEKKGNVISALVKLKH